MCVRVGTVDNEHWASINGGYLLTSKGSVSFSRTVLCLRANRLRTGMTFCAIYWIFAWFTLNSTQKIFTKLYGDGEFRENRRCHSHTLLGGVNTFLSALPTFTARFGCHFGTNDQHVMLFSICDFPKGRTAFCVRVNETTFTGVPWNGVIPWT